MVTDILFVSDIPFTLRITPSDPYERQMPPSYILDSYLYLHLENKDTHHYTFVL